MFWLAKYSRFMAFFRGKKFAFLSCEGWMNVVMSSWLNAFILVVLFAGNSSCVKKIDNSEGIPKIEAYYVHAYICPDSSTNIQVGKVSGITEEVQFINDAQVEVFNANKGKRWLLLNKNSGRYLNDCDLNYNDSVLVQITLGSGKISKKIRVPNAVKIQKVVKYTTSVGFIGPTRAYRISFKDSAYIDNYYRIYLKQMRRKYFENGDSLDFSELVSISGNELPFVRNIYNSYTTKEVLFSDETFNGLKNDLVIYERLPGLSANEVILSSTVVIENLNEDLYNYYNSRNAHIWQQSSIIQTPTQVQGNLEDVFGVVGGYSVDSYTVD